MEIKARAFPYPVLAPGFDDFTQGHISFDNPVVEVAPERYTIRFVFRVTHPDFVEMLENGSAAAGALVECRQNLYRVRWPVRLGPNAIEIKADELQGLVQVTPVISATREIPRYRPRFLNSDYDEGILRVPRHAVLAYGHNVEFIADPCGDRLRRISSIMRVIAADNVTRYMRVNVHGDRIRVEVSRHTFELYQKVAASRAASSVLASMLVLPVLVDVLHQVKREGPDAWDEFEARRWFQVIRLRLRTLQYPIEASDFDPLRAAQELLDSPFARGLSELFEHLDLEPFG